jgi:hypothetical protein
MKLKIEFTNGEQRIVEITHAADFKTAASKVLMAPAILTKNNEAFSTAMIVRIESLDE